MIYVLYNPLADNKQGEANAKKISEVFSGEEITYKNLMTFDLKSFFKEIKADDKVILCGGDGTLNRFVNTMADEKLTNTVYYFAAGSGNDFFNDVKEKSQNGLVVLNPYIEDLPQVTVNGKSYRFLNGVGFGIDGYCCEVGDEQRAKSDKKVNYTSIAIKGLLFHFKPANAKVTVDGVTTEFKKVWLAPTMNGRFYGGGMMITPAQDRENKDKSLTTGVFFKSGKIKTLIIFPTIFKGTHIKYTDIFKQFTGHNITVEFDRPASLQIDGETIKNVTKYTVKSAAYLKKEEEKSAAMA